MVSVTDNVGRGMKRETKETENYTELKKHVKSTDQHSSSYSSWMSLHEMETSLLKF